MLPDRRINSDYFFFLAADFFVFAESFFLVFSAFAAFFAFLATAFSSSQPQSQ